MPYRTPLDWLNLFLADVRGGLGPYVGIFLLTEQRWNQAAIGIVATVSGIIGLALQTPIGAFIDATQWKRGVVVAGVGVLTASALTIAVAPSFPPVRSIRARSRGQLSRFNGRRNVFRLPQWLRNPPPCGPGTFKGLYHR
jgi:hypothetical protein